MGYIFTFIAALLAALVWLLLTLTFADQAPMMTFDISTVEGHTVTMRCPVVKPGDLVLNGYCRVTHY